MTPTDTNQPDHIVDMHEMVTDTNQASEVRRSSLNKSDEDVKLEPMSNQASEDGELKDRLTKLISQDGWVDIQEVDVEGQVAAIQTIIRTEKLKLLDRLDSAVRNVQNLTAEEKKNQLAGLRIKTDVLAAIYNERNKLEVEL